MFFEVGPSGQLQRVESEAGLVSYCIIQRVWVLGAHGRVWHVDPSPDVVATIPGWRLWAWESRPMVRLQWDPGEWQWRDPFAAADSPLIPFFRYSARLGRHILLAGRQATPAAAEHWRREVLPPEFLVQFWRRLWGSPQPRRTVVFQWLVAHRGITVGTWLWFGGRPPDCTGCGYF